MDQLENVTILKKANIYFDGKVTSRTLLFADGSRKTLGIILPGQYTFGTADKEEMEIVAGTLNVLLPGSQVFTAYHAGQTFTVPAHSEFTVSTDTVCDYCCAYLPEA